VFDSPLEGFFGRLAVGKINLAEDTAKRLHRHAYSYSFNLFNPGKTVLVPDSSQPVKAGDCGSMSIVKISTSSRRSSRSELPLDQPAAILATNSKMGNNFLHNR
jgi:hypothetical protein